jgi:hypothetical protein
MKTLMTKITILITLAAACCTSIASDRLVSTLGTVKREISADRVAMTLELTARDNTIGESNKKLESMLADLQAQVAALHYPTTALTLKFRTVRKAREWNNEEKKYVPLGFDSLATVGVILVGLTNYSEFLTYLGTHDGFTIIWQSMGSSAEGQARKDAIGEALRSARAKAALLADEGDASLGKVLEVTEEEVETREFSGSTWGGNASDPREGTGAYPIGIFVRVRAKFELNAK